MVQFTDPSIRAAKPPETGNLYIWDSGLRGFGLRISAHGTKTFCVLIGSGRRQTIGRYPAISLADARGEARRILEEKTLGKVKPTHFAFDDAKEQFLRERTKTLRPRTLADYTRLLDKYFAYERTSIASLTPRMILADLSKLAPAEKHHAFKVARAFFRFCAAPALVGSRSMLRDGRWATSRRCRSPAAASTMAEIHGSIINH